MNRTFFKLQVKANVAGSLFFTCNPKKWDNDTDIAIYTIKLQVASNIITIIGEMKMAYIQNIHIYIFIYRVIEKRLFSCNPATFAVNAL